MVTDNQRKFIGWMIKHHVWRIVMSMRLPMIYTLYHTKWLLDWLLERQIVDDLHHAPCCPANHYHKTRLVFKPCTCGAVIQVRKENQG